MSRLDFFKRIGFDFYKTHLGGISMERSRYWTGLEQIGSLNSRCLTYLNVKEFEETEVSVAVDSPLQDITFRAGCISADNRRIFRMLSMGTTATFLHSSLQEGKEIIHIYIGRKGAKQIAIMSYLMHAKTIIHYVFTKQRIR